MRAILHELRQALRAIGKRPAFSALVIGVLAAGLACVIFMLTMIEGLILRPLPFHEPDRLLYVGVRDVGDREQIATDDLGDLADRDLLQIRRHLNGIADVASYAYVTINLRGDDQSLRLRGGIVSTNLFRVFGVAPILGRDFNQEDGQEGANPVAMLSYREWQGRYAGDPAIVGREIRINAHPVRIVGVMPKEYGFPGDEAMWLPYEPIDGKKSLAESNGLCIVARSPAVQTDAVVLTSMNAWLSDAAHTEPGRFHNKYALVEPFTFYSPGECMLFSLMLAATVLVLLVACANAANLLLTRTLGRCEELAVRVALGADRRRLATHLLMQSLLLSVIACTIALPIAAYAANWQEATYHRNGAPPWQHFSIDTKIVVVALVAAALTALASGLLPALLTSAHAIAGSLRVGARGGLRSFARASRILLVGEIALSCLLLVSLGTFTRAIVAIEHAPVGIDKNHLLTARIDLSTQAYRDAAEQVSFFERFTAALRTDTSVVDATIATVLPGDGADDHSVLAAGAEISETSLPNMKYGAVDDRFFSAYAIHLLEGRLFDSRDRADSERVAIVDRRFSDQFGDGNSVVGRRFRIDPRDPDAATVTVIGVIPTLMLTVPQNQHYRPSMLVPLRQASTTAGILAVRTRGSADAFAARLREIARNVDADTPVYAVADYRKVSRIVSQNERQNAQWFALFGFVALAIAGTGLFGAMVFVVGDRTREIGVRRALGASAGKILRTVFARAVSQVGVGLGLGLLTGIPFAHFLARYSQTLRVHDWRVFIVVAVILAIAALLAVIVPARRALRIDPMVALRHD